MRRQKEVVNVPEDAGHVEAGAVIVPLHLRQPAGQLQRHAWLDIQLILRESQEKDACEPGVKGGQCRHIRARGAYRARLLVQLIGNKNGFNVRFMALIGSVGRGGVSKRGKRDPISSLSLCSVISPINSFSHNLLRSVITGVIRLTWPEFSIWDEKKGKKEKRWKTIAATHSPDETCCAIPHMCGQTGSWRRRPCPGRGHCASHPFRDTGDH